MKLGVDFTLDSQGRAVLTKSYLERQGSCCMRGCANCPYTTEEQKSVVAKSNVPFVPCKGCSCGRKNDSEK